MKPTVSLRRALSDPQLLGRSISGESWVGWRILLLGALGEPLLDDERDLFRKLTGGRGEPTEIIEEFAAIIGRRGGKSRAISVLATYIAGLCEHPALVPGERGVCLIIAPDQRQADIVLDYIQATFEASPILKQLIETRVSRELRLNNGISIEVRASDWRNLRGPTFIAVICDECAFYLTSESYSTNPDTEILTSVKPGLATTGGPMYLISSPYSRKGELWRVYSKNFGPNSDEKILVAQAASRTMNPTLPQSVVDRALEHDPASAAAEYLAEFRRDIESFISIEAVQRCVTVGVYERPPESRLSYYAFVDPSGGSSDSMCLAIGHYDFATAMTIVDVLREAKPPFSPETVCEEFARLLKTYRIGKVRGDRYGGQWPAEQLGKFSIAYEPSEVPKSGLYIDLLAAINSHRVELLDHQKSIAQICNLERRTGRGGRDTIDKPFGSHDDLANVIAGLANANAKTAAWDPLYGWVDGASADSGNDPEAARASWRKQQFESHLASCGVPGFINWNNRR
jgi:hypothetical protein